MASSIITSSPFIMHHAPTPIKKTSKKVSMHAKRDSHNTSSSLIHVGSSIKIQKVFEDKSRGIVCYIDDKGEITCEGFDEGPRLHQSVSRYSFYQRGHQDIVELLNRSLSKVIDSGKDN